MPSEASRALHDIRACILSAQDVVAGHDVGRFREDRKTFRAVTRRLEIISEASRHLDPMVRDRHPETPWRAIRDSGDSHRHDCDDVAGVHVWTSVVDRPPTLMAVIPAGIERPEPRPWLDTIGLRPSPPSYTLFT